MDVTDLCVGMCFLKCKTFLDVPSQEGNGWLQKWFFSQTSGSSWLSLYPGSHWKDTVEPMDRSWPNRTPFTGIPGSIQEYVSNVTTGVIKIKLLFLENIFETILDRHLGNFTVLEMTILFFQSVKFLGYIYTTRIMPPPTKMHFTSTSVDTDIVKDGQMDNLKRQLWLLPEQTHRIVQREPLITVIKMKGHMSYRKPVF